MKIKDRKEKDKRQEKKKVTFPVFLVFTSFSKQDVDFRIRQLKFLFCSKSNTFFISQVDPFETEARLPRFFSWDNDSYCFVDDFGLDLTRLNMDEASRITLWIGLTDAWYLKTILQLVGDTGYKRLHTATIYQLRPEWVVITFTIQNVHTKKKKEASLGPVGVFSLGT